MEVSYLRHLPTIRGCFKMKNSGLLFLLLFVWGCSYEVPETSETADDFSGEDFLHFYVIGDGISSGIMDGVVIGETQRFSFPNMIGEKINRYYESDIFLQPSITNSSGKNVFEEDLQGRYELFYRTAGSPFPARRALAGEEPGEWTGEEEFLKNLSAPGVRSFQVDDESILAENQYLNQLPVGQGRSLLDFVIKKNPQIVMLNLGFEDLLPFVLGGAVGESDKDVNDISDTDPTPVSVFEAAVQHIVDRLREETDAKIIISTIPDPLLTPYLTTLRYHMELGRDIEVSQIGFLNNYYSEFNSQAFGYNYSDTVSVDERRPFIDFDVDGGNDLRARVIYDPALIDVKLEDGSELPKIRQMRSDEYLPYRLEERFFTDDGYGTTDPIQPEDVITQTDAEEIRTLLGDYNNIIRDIIASTPAVYLLDIEQIYEEAHFEEIRYNGVTYNARFARETVFSADGIFLNAKGNAIVANQLIHLFNSRFEAEIKQVDVNSYPGIQIDPDF